MNLEKKGNRKEWVKNVAIIFLSIMLVLTFFSNTIMNYSLPEVATSVIEPGSITAKIRGTGTLTSDDPYKIMIEETRVISSVAVKAGDTVEKDQVLFYLEDKESDELEAAEEELLTEEKALNDLILAFSTEILKGTITNQSYQNIQSGNISSNNEYQARITAAKQKVSDAQATVDSLERQSSIAGTAASTDIGRKAELEKEKENAVRKLEEAEKVRNDLQGKLDSIIDNKDKDVSAVMQEKHDAEIATVSANNLFVDSQKELSTKLEEMNKKANLSNIPEIKDFDKIQNINSELAEINRVYEEAKNLNESEEGTLKGQLTQELKEIADAMMMYRQCYEGVVAATVDFTNASKKAEEAMNISTTIATLQSQVNDANNYVNECQAKVDALTNEITNNSTNKEKQKADIEIAKINAKASLEQAQKELDQLLADVSGELNLDNQNDLISRQRDKVAKKREEVEKLREKSIGSTITAPVAGIVTSVNVTAGEKTDASRELAIMQPEGKGYSMSFSVTTEQAKKVKVGEIAEVQNSWFYSDIEATLTGIRPDPENANEKKLLVFDVKGDVQAGQSVSLSIGQRSAEYDLLVPNSAVKEDNQGKFILIVESKSSPLGNRYMAKRVDVQVLGADDLKTAISAPLFGYEYVITTATQPVEAGKQVRLAETN